MGIERQAGDRQGHLGTDPETRDSRHWGGREGSGQHWVSGRKRAGMAKSISALKGRKNSLVGVFSSKVSFPN